MDLEKLIGSKGRLRVLKLLLEEGQVNITRVVKETGLHHRLVVKHMNELKSMGLVEERRYGRLRLFEVDMTDPRISALRDMMRSIEEL